MAILDFKAHHGSAVVLADREAVAQPSSQELVLFGTASGPVCQRLVLGIGGVGSAVPFKHLPEVLLLLCGQRLEGLVEVLDSPASAFHKFVVLLDVLQREGVKRTPNFTSGLRVEASRFLMWG